MLDLSGERMVEQVTTIELPISHDVALRAERRVYKYPLLLTDNQTLHIPNGGQILCVQMQGGDLCLWALVNPNYPLVPREIRVAGTGHPIQQDIVAYIGTVQLPGGVLVYHVFEVRG